MRKIAIVLWAAQLIVAVVAAIFASVEIESIVFTGPILSVVGVALAIVTLPLRSWTTLLFALSAPLICGLGAFAISVFHWGPAEAKSPIGSALSMYAIAIWVPALFVIDWIRRWQTDRVKSGPRSWQFSLKSLLIGMTVVCVMTAVGNVIGRMAIPDFPIVFGTYALVVVSISLVVIWRFLCKHNWPTKAVPAVRHE